MIELLCSRSKDINLIKLLNESFVSDHFWYELSSIILIQVFNDTVEVNKVSYNRIVDQYEEEALKVIEYYISLCHMLEEAEQISQEANKQYWQKSIEKVLNSIAFFLIPTEGTLSKYLLKEGVPSAIIKGILKLIAHFFSFNPRLNKYFNKEWTLFYIRTHYINFIRLYNKGINSSDEKTVIELCKAHIKCLLAIAKNRNEETSRNFYKLRCIEFLTREVDLEYTSEVIGKTHNVQKKVITQFTPSFTEKADKKSNQAIEEKKLLDSKLHKKHAKEVFINPIAGVMLPQRPDNSNETTVKSFKPHIKQESSIIKIEPPVRNEDVSVKNEETPKKELESNRSIGKKGESRVAKGDLGRSEVSSVIKKNLLSKPKETEVQEISDTTPTRIQNKSRLQVNPRNDKPKVLLNLHRPETVSVISLFEKSIIEGKEEVKSTFKPPEPSPNREGTYVGSNRVWVPLLKFPQNIDNYKEGGKVPVKIDRANDSRFQLKRTTKEDLNKSLMPPSLDKSIEGLKIGKKGLLDTSYFGGNKGKLAPPKGNLKLNIIVKEKEAKKEQYRNPPEEEINPYTDNEEGRLSAIEVALKTSKNKWQLISENTKNVLNPFMQCNTDDNEIDILKERTYRTIYKDKELHGLLIGLLFALLLKPPRGVLDDLYCSANPLDDNKKNTLYLLHFHLNHPLNQEILPLVFEVVKELRPPLAGQRLLKLLCKHFFDLSIYTGWSKIATGAFGTVFECSTNLLNPKLVAIKQLEFPNTIYGRCVLYDIFNEISALQELRGEDCAVALYDYGVDDNNYYLVMKRYTCSLREWRLKQKQSLNESLTLYLNVFNQVLKAVKVTHQHNITHYDLKCDNFLLEDNNIALGDYGECKLFNNKEDEYDMMARGTECIKSPEMLTLTVQLKKSNENKIGTTRASDIWSLGCLFYELLAGDYLFSNDDYVIFYLRVTSEEESILTEDKIKALNGNVYLLNFLSYLLVRNPEKRPNIEQVLDQFKHLHALLVNMEMNKSDNILFNEAKECRVDDLSLNDLQLKCTNMMRGNAIVKIIEKEVYPIPNLTILLKNLYLCSVNYFYAHKDKLIKKITHIVIPKHLYKDNIDDAFTILSIETCHCKSQKSNNYNLIPTVLDYFRKVSLHKDTLLFIDDALSSCRECKGPKEGTIRETLLVILGYILENTGYEAWTLCNSQTLFFSVHQDTLYRVTEWLELTKKLTIAAENYLKYTCLCGNCTFVLEKIFSEAKDINSKLCSCSGDRTTEVSGCPSRNCGELLRFVKVMYKIKWEHINWGYFKPSQLFVGNGDLTWQKALVNSDGPIKNSVCCGHTEKVQWGESKKLLKWDLYQCKTCRVWTHAITEDKGKIAIVLNNPICKFATNINSKEDESSWQ